MVIAYFWPAVRAMVPLFSVGAWSVQLLMSCWPLTVSLTPSSEVVKKVYVCEKSGCTCPVQRTEKLSAPTEPPGEPVPKSKLTVASVRENADGAVRVRLLK